MAVSRVVPSTGAVYAQEAGKPIYTQSGHGVSMLRILPEPRIGVLARAGESAVVEDVQAAFVVAGGERTEGVDPLHGVQAGGI